MWGLIAVADRLVGDVDYAGVLEVASYLTPVPGVSVHMTVAMLLKNTLSSYERRF
jgi:methylenetetrahydrofolate dehydrogenase (NADP+)/methenyltetrahydrofolate cyclohydrolase